ncbi:hypothetical protein EJ110_NYTH15460 [Nymphaea thermarum]|nr:hypothetical protein EJ110_NYTH15460 [Nymphaea thermarum]
MGNATKRKLHAPGLMGQRTLKTGCTENRPYKKLKCSTAFHSLPRNSLPRDPELSLPSTYLFLCSSCVSTPQHFLLLHLRLLPRFHSFSSVSTGGRPPQHRLIAWQPLTNPRPTYCARAGCSGPTTSESGGFSYTLWWCFWVVLLHANRQQQLKPSSSVHLRER